MAVSPNTILYLGPPSSYSNAAAIRAYPHAKQVPCRTIADIFTALQEEKEEEKEEVYGIVPIENSTHGPVVQTLDLFAGRHQDNVIPDLVVCAEIYLPVHHCLLGRRRSRSLRNGNADNDDLASHIKRVHSHPQALGQCQRFLCQRVPAAELRESSSTAAAAALVADDDSGESAAIASELAGEVYGLDVLQREIEDRSDNETRFLVIKRTSDAALSKEPKPHLTNVKTLVSFTIDHQKPGALADALAVFKKHGLNFTSINSRPSRDRAWHYVFFVEVQGANGIGLALKEFADATNTCRWLGTWTDASSKKQKTVETAASHTQTP